MSAGISYYSTGGCYTPGLLRDNQMNKLYTKVAEICYDLNKFYPGRSLYIFYVQIFVVGLKANVEGFSSD